MSVLYFHNPGEIDIRGATIAGLSAKDDASSAIGFFGTGLKYAVACVLRMGGNISIYSGTTRHEFNMEPLEFRNRDFQQITMLSGPVADFPTGANVARLGFTTEYGKTWEPWQVFRELYANALDEGGGVSTTYHEPLDGCTVVVIDCFQVYLEFANRDSIILPQNRNWQHDDGNVQISDETAVMLYYRGVRVRAALCALTYNVVHELQLTEDRTLSGTAAYRSKIEHAISKCNDETLVYKALTADDIFFEHNLDFPSWRSYSPEFLNVAKRLYQQSPRKHKRLKELIKSIAPELDEPVVVGLSGVQAQMLDRAKTLVRRMGMPVDSYPIIVADTGEDTLGLFNKATGKIYIDPKAFAKGTKEVLCTLYEELTHATTGHDDCCYPMQTHLFEKIISLYEEFLFKEPV